MAAIENLEILVEVDISEALTSLQKLQDELEELGDQISRVDKRGSEGIDIRTDLDDITDDLAATRAKMEAFERTASVDIPMEAHVAGLGHPTMTGLSTPELTGRFQDDMLAGFTEADLDFGGFNIPRGEGIGGGRRGSRIGRMLRNLGSEISDTLSGMTDFRLRMSDMHNAMATMVPILLVFLGVIPTAVAAMASLAAAAFTAAGALLAIGGLGLLGAAGGGDRPSMEEIQSELSEITDMFWEAFAPLARSMAPIFERGLDGLNRFFEAIAAEGDALMSLVDEIQGFGGFIMGFFPSMLRTLSATLEALAPIFNRIGGFIQDNFQPIMRDLVQVTLESAPALGKLLERLGSAAMRLAEIGKGFAIVASAILRFLGWMGMLIDFLGISNQQIGLVIGSLLTFATAVSLANTRLIQLAVGGIMTAARAMGAFAFNVWLGNRSLTVFGTTAIANAIKGLISLSASLIQSAFAFLGLEISAYKAAAAAATFWSVVSLGLAIPLLSAIGSMTAGFLGLADGITNATDSLKEFDRVAGRTSGTELNPYAPNSGTGQRGSQVRSSGSQGGTTINYESSGDPERDQSNLDKALFRANRTTGDT